MSKVKLHNQEGKVVGDITLEPKIFNIDINPVVVQQAVRTQQANKRKVIAHTKTRSDVRGGGRKPWRQKGTGRARVGSTRSPLWKGGGVTFGPRNDRNYSLKINKKVKKKALFMALSDKVNSKLIVVLDKFDLPEIKTKTLGEVITKLKLTKKVLIVLPKKDINIEKSAKNIKKIKIINANSLNVVDVLGNEHLVILKKSLAVIKETYLK